MAEINNGEDVDEGDLNLLLSRWGESGAGDSDDSKMIGQTDQLRLLDLSADSA